MTIALRVPTGDPRADPLEGEGPIGDLAGLLSQLREQHMLGTRRFFTSYLLLAEEASSVDDVLGSAGEDGWETASYATPEGLVLRLSKRRRVTAARLEADGGEVRELARSTGARWFGFAVEDLALPNRWDELARRVRERTTRDPQG